MGETGFGFIAILSNTWTATDPCGNDTSVTIFIQHDNPPVFTSVLADTIITCGDEIPAFEHQKRLMLACVSSCFSKIMKSYGSYRVRIGRPLMNAATGAFSVKPSR
ncbi:MAG: hypothetical protein R2788_03505 [Saprospiraceae bacterium]